MPEYRSEGEDEAEDESECRTSIIRKQLKGFEKTGIANRKRVNKKTEIWRRQGSRSEEQEYRSEGEGEGEDDSKCRNFLDL